MKKIGLLTCLVWAITIHAIGGTTLKLTEPNLLDKYDLSLENTIVLPTNFAEPFIVDQSDIDRLGEKVIHHVDLVYTQFRSSKSFDQRKLNENRIRQLEHLLPQIGKDKPTLRTIEQTGAKEADVAKTYFHGFVIHYGDPLDYRSLNGFFKNIQEQFVTNTVAAETGGEFNFESGTRIRIEPNSVTYPDGTPVKGDFELSYREFKNPAEIALSGIPMTYHSKKETYNFSSVGMYEIRGSKDGIPLKMSKPAQVDFNCTNQAEGVGFYQMDDESGKWKKLEDVHFNPQNPVEEKRDHKVDQTAAIVEDIPQEVGIIAELKGYTGSVSLGTKKRIHIDYELKASDSTCTSSMNAKTWRRYRRLSEENDSLFQGIEILEVPEKHEVITSAEDLHQFLNTVLSDGRWWGAGWFGFKEGKWHKAHNWQEFNGKPVANDEAATLLAAGADAGHTYPAMVRGLNSKDFGVYNCDQIYRIGKSKSISPEYVDAATGKAISQKHVSCVLDLSYNGSFSFPPNYLTLNADGKNVILLFTRDKKVFMMKHEDFAKVDLESTAGIKLAMVDVTSKIRTSSDLKPALEI